MTRQVWYRSALGIYLNARAPPASVPCDSGMRPALNDGVAWTPAHAHTEGTLSISGLARHMRNRGTACRGTTLIELVVVLAIIGIVLAAAWGWTSLVTMRKLQNAAFMLEGDLRWAQQQAVSNAGNGPQVEVCFRSNGYDVYTTTYSGSDVLNVNYSTTTPSIGGTAKIRSVNAGQEYDTNVQFTLPSSGTVTCDGATGESAVAFRSSGQPLFTDTNSHAVSVSLNGHTYHVTIQPITGSISVSSQ